MAGTNALVLDPKLPPPDPDPNEPGPHCRGEDLDWLRRSDLPCEYSSSLPAALKLEERPDLLNNGVAKLGERRIRPFSTTASQSRQAAPIRRQKTARKRALFGHLDGLAVN
jgi:hypothetical protein